MKEALERKLEAMRRELAGPDPSPLERLLADRIVACWLQVQFADTLFARNVKHLSPAQGDYYQRLQDRAHRRYLSAIRTLAQVRKLLVPLVQVNIAERQVNVAQVGVPIGGDGPESLGETGDAVEALEWGESPDGAE